MSDVRDAGIQDRAGVAAMLGRAFAGDPAMSYIFPDPVERARRLPRLFALLFDGDADGMRLVAGPADAATLWRAPARAATPLGAMVAQAPALIGALGTAIPRALRISGAIGAHFPVEPFWYLHVAGVDPTQQGRGLGGRVIRAGLARNDASGHPTYLETATESNLGLYGALGFKLIGDWEVPRGGPRFWSMQRAVGG
ncbi:MAG: GNAT family N-acetyltransferase [Sphingomonas adhaesiva]|uniref:GNAT family N-acetyltransferase n=1 Tax=Sphingomonas adhaesiva TaxID=28212 RepID=UPI002FFA9444